MQYPQTQIDSVSSWLPETQRLQVKGELEDAYLGVTQVDTYPHLLSSLKDIQGWLPLSSKEHAQRGLCQLYLDRGGEMTRFQLIELILDGKLEYWVQAELQERLV